MADLPLMTLVVDADEDGAFWISIDGQEELGRKGPYATELEAAAHVSAFLNEVVAALTLAALGA